MIIDALLEGEQAARFLPFALSRLRTLHRHSPTGARAERYAVDGYDIFLQYTPWRKLLRIIGQSYFEFFASGKPVITETVTDPVSGVLTQFKPVTVGVGLSTKNGVSATDPQILGGKRTTKTATVSALGQEHQANLANEPNSLLTKGTEKPGSSFPRLLYESWAPMHSNTLIFTRHFSRQATSGGFASNLERDVTYDVSFGTSTGKSFIRYAYLFGASDWPRATGIQKVVDATWGTREFAIYVDASSQFWVFPTSVIPAGGRGPAVPADDIDPKYVKGTARSFPSWAFHAAAQFKTTYASGGLAATEELPEIDWKLHPDGTKACAVVWKRVPLAYDAAYFAGLVAGANDPAAAFATTESTSGYAQTQGLLYPADNVRYLLAPGLLESTIVIHLTGPDPENFTLSGATSVVRDPETCAFGTVVAGYTWHDVPDAAARGDLCVLDIEAYWNPANSSASLRILNILKNLTQGIDVAVVNGTRLNDFDMKTLSFAGEQQTLSTYTFDVPIRAGYPVGVSGTGPTVPDDGHAHKKLPATTNVTFSVGHPQVAVWTFAKLREVLYPPGIPDAQKLLLNDVTPAAARAGVAGLTLFPMNDVTDWSTHTELRHWLSFGLGYTATTYTLSTTSEIAFYKQILSAFPELMFLQVPRFGFYLYANLLMQLMRKHPRSVLFAHPNGSWGYFDTSIIYNKNGVTAPLAFYNTLAMFDASKLSVALFDRLHLVVGKGTALNTSFVDTYNTALTGSRGANTITDTLLPLAASDFTPTFAKGQYDYTVPGGTVDDNGKVFSWLELAAHYPTGETYYIHDQGYITGAPEQGSVPYGSESVGSPTSFGGGNMFDQSLDAVWTTAPGYAGVVSNPTIDFGRCAFSTPTMVVS